MLTSCRVILAAELTKNTSVSVSVINRLSIYPANQTLLTILTHLMTHTASEQQCEEDDNDRNGIKSEISVSETTVPLVRKRKSTA